MRDIRTLDLNLLKAFEALMDERSVTRAAERLALTQPAVSAMLQRLRESFDDPLFVRSPRGVVPTPRALALAEPVRRVLAEIGRWLAPPMFEPASAEFTVRLAATDYALRAVVAPFIAALRQQAPKARVQVQPLDAAQLPEQLERGALDIALLTPETTSPAWHMRHLYDEDYVCALRADHPDAQGGVTTLPLARFCALAHILVSYSGDPFWGVTDEALAQRGLTRCVGLSVASFLILPELLRHSDDVAVVPRRLVAGVPGLAVLAPPLALPGFTKVAAWHERTHHDPTQQWVRQLLAASLTRPPAPCTTSPDWPAPSAAG